MKLPHNSRSHLSKTMALPDSSARFLMKLLPITINNVRILAYSGGTTGEGCLNELGKNRRVELEIYTYST